MLRTSRSLAMTSRGSCESTSSLMSNNQPVIHEISRVSTPGRRVYVGKDEIPRVKNGLGCAILSTSKGVLA